MVTAAEGRSILSRYLIRIARTVSVDGHLGLAREQYADARSVDPIAFEQHTSPLEQQLALRLSVAQDT